MRHESTFYYESLSERSAEIRLDSESSHHLLKVMRVKVGATLSLCNGRGLEAKALLLEPGRKALLALHDFKQHAPHPMQIDVWMPVIKASRLEFALEKLCELAVSNIYLMESDNTGNAKTKIDVKRLERILVAALQQSRNPWLPTLHAPRPLGELIERGGSKLLLADPTGTAKELEQILQSASQKQDPLSFALLCGPEGGFSESEYDRLQTLNCLKVGLGPCVLRAETAILGLVSVLHATQTKVQLDKQ
jgi:16S rRNA (uracil1498-N3)-methyltransferase